MCICQRLLNDCILNQVSFDTEYHAAHWVPASAYLQRCDEGHSTTRPGISSAVVGAWLKVEDQFAAIGNDISGL
jgi:hypothetical protein